MSGLFDYYVSAGYTTPEVADPPSSDDYFIRAQDATYVESGYWDAGYVLRTLEGISDVNITAGLSVTVGPIEVEGTAGLSIAATFTNNITRVKPFSSSFSVTANSSITSNGIKSASANISGVLNANVSANARLVSSIIITANSNTATGANGVFSGTATLTTITTDRSWSEAGTWSDIAPPQWAPTLRVTAVVNRIGTANNINASAGLNSNSETLKPGSITANISTGINLLAGKSGFGSATLPTIVAGLTSEGTTNIVGEANNLDINSSLTSSGQSSQLAYGTLNITGAVVSASGRIRPFVETSPIVSSMSVSGSRIRPYTATAAVNTLLNSDGFRAVVNEIQLAVILDTSTLGNYRKVINSTLDINTNLSSLGGKRIGMAFNEYRINANTSTSGILVRIDPYRTIATLPELRVRQNPQETRKITTNKELRVNTTSGETRGITCRAETRSWLLDRGIVTKISSSRKERA